MIESRGNIKRNDGSPKSRRDEDHRFQSVGCRSGHTYSFTKARDGRTDVDAVVVRDGKNVKGRILGGLLTIAGKRVLGSQLAKTVKAVEARNDGSAATDST